MHCYTLTAKLSGNLARFEKNRILFLLLRAATELTEALLSVMDFSIQHCRICSLSISPDILFLNSSHTFVSAIRRTCICSSSFLPYTVLLRLNCKLVTCSLRSPPIGPRDDFHSALFIPSVHSLFTQISISLFTVFSHFFVHC